MARLSLAVLPFVLLVTNAFANLTEVSSSFTGKKIPGCDAIAGGRVSWFYYVGGREIPISGPGVIPYSELSDQELRELFTRYTPIVYRYGAVDVEGIRVQRAVQDQLAANRAQRRAEERAQHQREGQRANDSLVNAVSQILNDEMSTAEKVTNIKHWLKTNAFTYEKAKDYLMEVTEGNESRKQIAAILKQLDLIDEVDYSRMIETRENLKPLNPDPYYYLWSSTFRDMIPRLGPTAFLIMDLLEEAQSRPDHALDEYTLAAIRFLGLQNWQK